ncbi:death-associated protein 1 homolog [Tubulanus polymorphus]|uniref:death-associated protein 1 homolog n=1 Tax=Tubulanus polymorphus TaxID=672921 RepID=UPI003DA68AD7
MADQASSKAPDAELKAGHAPAVKAGGMRVARHHVKSSQEPPKPPTEEEQEEFGLPPNEDMHKQKLVIAGSVTKGDKDFPPAAVKAYHEKPQPTHDNKPHNAQRHHVIHQPSGKM